MPSVITITFNPCIDKSVEVPQLIPEKKLSCTLPKMEAGGGGINVARAITKLGGEALAIFPGGGAQGKLLKDLLLEEAVPVVQVDTGREIRENWIVLETSTNHQFRFGMPGPVLPDAIWQDCLDRVAQEGDAAFIVVSGSLPEGFPTNIFERIAAVAEKKHARLVVDTSGIALQHALRHGVHLIKPSINELNSLIAALQLDASSPVAAAQEIVKRGYAEAVVVSMGPEGAMLVTGSIVKHIKPPTVKKASTVGAGDSMVAGIVHSLARHASLEDAVTYGVACGTAATMNPGTALCKLEDVELLHDMIRKQYRDLVS
ncbi:MAG TPA: hexose kinase [Puia sp.]|nr:hexose kinase [Puia sp.]